MSEKIGVNPSRLLVRLIASLRPARLASATLDLFGVKRMAFMSDRGTFWVDPGSHFGRELMDSNNYDQVVTGILDNYLKPGSTFVDIGANEGYFSVLASKLVGISGRVIAVEPQSRLQPIIQQNLTLNGCANVEVRRCVIAEKAGAMALTIAPRTNSGASSLFTTGGKTETVTALTFADLFLQAEIAGCDLMKIDVEGAEYDIITSSTELLKSGRIGCLSVDLHDSILAERKLSVGPIHFTLAKCGYSLLRGSHPALYTLDASWNAQIR